MSTLVSIIVPVYNAMTTGGGHIRRCIDSVLHQTGFPLASIELILVNDGSMDSTPDVLEDIRNSHPETIRVIHQRNMGVASARNHGIAQASGQYIVFIDQDDWIDSDFIKVMFQAANASNLDYVIAGYRRPDSTGNNTRTFRPSKQAYGRYTLGAAWAKIHKRIFLVENSIIFFDNAFGEDIIFTTSENLSSQSYAIIDYVGYNWFLNKKSVSNSSQIGFTKTNIQAIERLTQKLSSQAALHGANAGDDFHYYCLRTLVFYAIHSGQKSSVCDRSQGFLSVMECARRQMPLLFNGNKLKRLKKPKGEMASVHVLVTAFLFLHNARTLHALSRICSLLRKATPRFFS